MILAASDIPAAPVLALMAFGVILATFGHIWKSRSLVATGLTILFLASAAMVVGAYLSYRDDSGDPREQRDPRDPTL